MAEVIFLGRGAGYKPSLGPTAAYFREGTRLYLIDCGTSAFERLDRMGAFGGVCAITVFISHLHADHAGSLGILLEYCSDVLRIRPVLVHPGRSILAYLDITGTSRESYTWRADYKSADENGVRAVFYPVTHVPGMDCYGYLISTATQDSFYFSGDAVDIPSEILSRLYDGSLDCVYQDTASTDSKSHCALEKLKALVPEAYRSHVYCVHLDTEEPDAFLEAGFRITESSL